MEPRFVGMTNSDQEILINLALIATIDISEQRIIFYWLGGGNTILESPAKETINRLRNRLTKWYDDLT